jgi:hypothetical protein
MKELEDLAKFINELPPVLVKIKVSPRFNEALKNAIPVGAPPKSKEEFFRRQFEGVKIEIDYTQVENYKLIYNK